MPAALRLLVVVLLVSLPVPVRASLHFDVYAGFYPANFLYLQDGSYDDRPVAVDTSDFSYDGALCPAPGTSNFLCARGRAAAGIGPGGRLYLRAGARMKRTDAQFKQEHGVYGGAHIDILSLGGYTAGPAPGAFFVFGLHGTISSSASTAAVTVNSFSQATLYAGPASAIQCFGPMGCAPGARSTVKVVDWDPAGGLSLDLRSDVKMFNPSEVTGWDGEGVADFYDTLELLAIQLVDADDVPIPGVLLTYTDSHGVAVVIPDTPPDPEATATPTPTPTATPACANPPCEDCENCIDDDHDGAVDRADEDCAPPANGGGLGLADPAAAKKLDKCAKAIRKVGAKLTTTKLGKLQTCVKAVTDCVQLKPNDASCLTSAQATCTKARSGLADAETTLMAAVVKACDEPTVAVSALGAPTGLGYSGETIACARRGVAGLGTAAAVAECLRRQHACAVERVVGFAVPRAGELLTLGGWDPASELPCLTNATIGGAAGIAAPKQKALRKCDRGLQKATAKLASGRIKAVQACGAAVFTCDQTKPGEPGCLDSARKKCGKAFGGTAKLAASFTAAIAKACGAAPLDIADLRAPEGLGVSVLDGPCAALGVASPATLGDLTTCLGQQLACRVDQLLENEIPRFTELLEAVAD